MKNSINNNGKNSSRNNKEDKVLARLTGKTAARMLRALENDACLRFHLVKNNNDHDLPVIEIIKD
jgi:hypothetical protein